jgi:hypothetical protein
MSTIHPTWDVDRVTARIASLTADAEKAEAIAEAFSTAADEHYREAATRRAQIAHVEDMTSKPRKASA